MRPPRISLNRFVNTGEIVHEDRTDWLYERITTPRPGWQDNPALKLARDLRALIPGEEFYVGQGVYVTKLYTPRHTRASICTYRLRYGFQVHKTHAADEAARIALEWKERAA